MLFGKFTELKFTHGPTNSTQADKSRAGIGIGNGETYLDPGAEPGSDGFTWDSGMN
jgi:hypothetical protein